MLADIQGQGSQTELLGPHVHTVGPKPLAVSLLPWDVTPLTHYSQPRLHGRKKLDPHFWSNLASRVYA